MSLLTDLVGYWKCDEASGNLLDAHGSNPFVQSAASANAVTGKINNGRYVDDDIVGQYFSIADNADVSLGADTDFTWWIWYKPDSTTVAYVNDRMFITKFKSSPSSNNDCEYRIRLSSGVGFDVGNGSSSATVQDTGNHLTGGAWHLILAWHDSANNILGLRINNGTALTTSWSGGTQNTNGTVYINTQTNVLGANAHQMPKGVIDEIGFSKRVLTSGEQASLYNSGNGLPYSDFGSVGGATGNPWHFYRQLRGAA